MSQTSESSPVGWVAGWVEGWAGEGWVAANTAHVSSKFRRNSSGLPFDCETCSAVPRHPSFPTVAQPNLDTARILFGLQNRDHWAAGFVVVQVIG